MDRRASVSVIAALAAVPLILMTGLAVDAARLYLLDQRLQTAVDAATILAAKEMGTSGEVADAQALFWGNFGRGYRVQGNSVTYTDVGFLNASTAGATVTAIDSAHVQVSAQAALPMTFMMLGGFSTMTVSASATAQKGGGFELAMVLDVSGSMLDSAGTGQTKEQALQQAADDALDTLYGVNNDTQPNLWVSVVPFQASVSLGAHTGWLAAGTYSAANYASQGWRGCMEARTNGHDATEDNPATAPFTPYRWASTYDQYSTTINGRTSYLPGDNDWQPGNITNTNPPGGGSPYTGLTYGPNLGCPMTSVLPLTASKATVKNAVNSMVAISGGSTLINLGLQAGWFTLSPLWEGYWGSNTSPLAYNTPDNTKVIILMTDGNNEWDHQSSVAPESQRVDAYYTSYGRASQNRLGVAMPSTGNLANDENTLQPELQAALDNKTLALCTTLKNQGVLIYTIGFQADQTSINLLQGCATSPADFFNSQDGSDIENAFQQIAAKLSVLRLTQ
ncbi:MAG: VWA domain-containing protein [Acidisphaera sp.]|nr:VWA domain-containing protein [Acidisphaera sp.]